MKDLLKKLLITSTQKDWNKNHILNWKESLEINESSFSFFQLDLLNKLEGVLNDYAIAYTKEITAYQNLSNGNKISQLITLTTLDKKSKFWIYPNMADWDIEDEHQIYEEWGYLKPEDLFSSFLQSTKEL